MKRFSKNLVLPVVQQATCPESSENITLKSGPGTITILRPENDAENVVEVQIYLFEVDGNSLYVSTQSLDVGVYSFTFRSQAGIFYAKILPRGGYTPPVEVSSAKGAEPDALYTGLIRRILFYTDAFNPDKTELRMKIQVTNKKMLYPIENFLRDLLTSGTGINFVYYGKSSDSITEQYTFPSNVLTKDITVSDYYINCFLKFDTEAERNNVFNVGEIEFAQALWNFKSINPQNASSVPYNKSVYNLSKYSNPTQNFEVIIAGDFSPTIKQLIMTRQPFDLVSTSGTYGPFVAGAYGEPRTQFSGYTVLLSVQPTFAATLQVQNFQLLLV